MVALVELTGSGCIYPPWQSRRGIRTEDKGDGGAEVKPTDGHQVTAIVRENEKTDGSDKQAFADGIISKL